MTNIITIGGKDYIIPELKFGLMKKLWPYIQPKDISGSDAVFNVLSESEKVITICLQNFYPEITDDFLDKNAEFYEISAAIEVIRPMIHDAITKKKITTQAQVPVENQENTSNGIGAESMPD